MPIDTSRPIPSRHRTTWPIRWGPVRTRNDSTTSSSPPLLTSTAIPSSLGLPSAAIPGLRCDTLANPAEVAASNTSSKSGWVHHSCKSTASDAPSSSAT